MSEVHVTGLVDLQKFLDALPVKLEKNVMRGALRAGVKPIKAAAVSMCPVGQPSTEGRRLYGLHEGSLRDSIRISTRTQGATVMATVKAGGKGKWGDVFYAHMIEFTGSVAHIISGRGGYLAFLGIFTKVVNHPGMRPKAFMRPALDQQAQNAVIAAGEYIKNRLATKEGLDTSYVMIEGDEQ